MIAFGPELVGRTEKTLGALLNRTLASTGLNEREYVTLKIASTLDVSHDLIEAARTRARFSDADEIVAALTQRGLLADGRLSPAGLAILDGIVAKTTSQTGAIWTELPDDDVAATTRVMNVVLSRAEALLAG